MKRVFFLAFAIVFCSCFSAQAQEVRATFGTKEDNTAYAVEFKNDGIVYFRPEGGVKFAYEDADTNDTITTQETGKTFIVSPSSDTTFTLPDADVGMQFTFIAADGDGDDSKQIILDPQDGDTFRGVVNSSAATTFAAGDSVKSPGDTGDSITIFVAEDGFWDVKDLRGTWTDNN